MQGCLLRNGKPFQNGISNLRTLFKFSVNGDMSSQQNPQHALPFPGLYINLKPMVPCVMLIREIPGGFEHRQILLPELWSWNLLHGHRRSLPHNVLVRQKLVERAYGAFLKQLGEEFVKKNLWSDEAQFKLNGTVNRH